MIYRRVPVLSCWAGCGCFSVCIDFIIHSDEMLSKGCVVY